MMAENYDEVRDTITQLVDQLKADDAVEDAAYEATITQLQAQVEPLIAERDALLAEKAGTIVDLIASRDSLDARITALEA